MTAFLPSSPHLHLPCFIREPIRGTTQHGSRRGQTGGRSLCPLPSPRALTQFSGLGLTSRSPAQHSYRRTTGRHPAKQCPSQVECGTNLQRGFENETGLPVSAGPRPQLGSARQFRSCWNTDTRSCHLPEGGRAATDNQVLCGGAHSPLEAEAAALHLTQQLE